MHKHIRAGVTPIVLLCLAVIAAMRPATVRASDGYPAVPAEQPEQAVIEAAFDQAASEFGVPAEILKAVAFVESRWVQFGPTIDGGWGVMHLVESDRAETLQAAAIASGETVDALKHNALANIRGGAALLADLVRQTAGTASMLEDYRPALKSFTGLLPDAQSKQVEEYYRILREGARATNAVGMTVALSPSTLPTGMPAVQTMDYTVMSTDYPPAIWIPAASGNYANGRSGNSITYWINHWTVGSYAAAISWFQDPSSKVSAHFVVRQSDGELTQMVRIANTAYHAGNLTYNRKSIGIEHEGSPSYPWPTSSSAPMLIVSTDACRYFCDLYGIPKTRSYILGHQEVPGVNTACPGPLPWDLYMAMVNNTTPTILQHPTAATVCPGTTAAFSVNAVGAGTLNYQWQKNSVDLTNGGRYSGCTLAVLTISGTSPSDVADYRCVVGNANGSTTSNSAALTLRAVTTVTQDPQPQTVPLGGTATFTVTGTGDGTLNYQWRRYDVNMTNSSRISGVNSTTLQITNAGASDVASYKCVLSATCGSDTSAAAILSLEGIPGDFDGDNDVDLADYGVFQACVSGNAVPQNDPACARAHLEGNDSDVDSLDLEKFLACMTAPGIPGNTYCAD